MIIDKYLYFRTVDDEDADDGSDDSVYVPVRNITGIETATTTTIKIYFKQLYNQQGGNELEDMLNDNVTLNVTAGKTQQVIRSIVQAINGNKLYNDGVIVIADDMVTNLANDTVSAKYIDSGITSCGAISVDGAF